MSSTDHLSTESSSYEETEGEFRTIVHQSNSPLSSLRATMQLNDNSLPASERGRIRDRNLEYRRYNSNANGFRASSAPAFRYRSKSPAAARSAHGIGEDKLSNMQACMHIVKASFGTGVLSLPSAIKNAGLLFGTVSIFLVCWIVIHSMHLLVQVAQFVRKYFDTDEEDADLDYGEIFDLTFQIDSSGRLEIFRLLKPVLNGFLIIAQIGFLSVYILFISENMAIFVEHFEPVYKPPIILYEFILVLLFIPLLFVRTLDKLAPLSMLANITGFLGLGLILLCCFRDLKPVTKLPLIKTAETIPLFFGTVVFSFESINLILPIESKMKDKKALGGTFGVLTLATAVVVAMDISIAFYGYVRFGDDVSGSLSYSIPTDKWYYLIVPPLYSVSIFITYGLQFYVVFIIIWESIERRLYTPRMLYWGEIILRISILTVTFILATVVPHVELMISLVGAISGSAICLIFPPFLHSIVVYYDRENRNCYQLIIFKNSIIMTFGVIGGIIGTYVSILQIIEVFKNR